MSLRQRLFAGFPLLLLLQLLIPINFEAASAAVTSAPSISSVTGGNNYLEVNFSPATGATNYDYSTDGGITWTGLGTTMFSVQGNGVSWTDALWVATGQGTNTIIYSNDGTTWYPAPHNSIFSEGYGIGTNPKVGPTPIPSAITLNNRDKVCVNSPRYYDSDLADDTTLVFNLEV
mgnify:CR=1 FL=1